MTTSISRRVLSAACLLTLIGLCGRSVVAQPPPPLPGTSGGPAQTAADEPRVRRIYVPTTELDALLNQDRRGVLLPKEEFRRLFTAAQAADEAAPNTPGGIVVTAAEYAGQIVDEQLQLTATVQLTQFDDHWQIARLPLSGLHLQSATLDGSPAAIAREGKNRNVLMLFSDTAGPHTLRMTMTTPLKSVGSDWLAEFHTLGAPAGQLALRVPDGKSLLVDGLQQPPADGADGDYAVPLGGRPQVSLRLTDRDLRHAADALVFASTAYGLQVAPGEVTWNTQTSVQAYGQSLGQLKFSVPKELEVAAVESTGLEEWTLGETDRGRRTLITLDYRQPFEGERTVTIRGVLVPESEEWSVPNLVLEEADSHAATILVKHGPDVRLQSEQGDEVRPVSGETPGTLQYRTMDAQFDLEFRTLGKQRSVQVAMTNLLDISDDGLDLQSVMDIDTYFVSLFDVRLTLPADFAVTAAAVGETPVEWSIGTGAAGVIEVRIPLEPPLKPGESRRVSLSAHADPEDWPVEGDPVLLGFPEVGLPQANMVEARYGIIADADLEVRTIELSGLDPARQADREGLRQVAAAVGKQLRLGFNYQDTVFTGQLEVTRKPTRLAVSTLSLSRLDPQQVQTGLQAFVTVEGGGTEGLLVEVPEQTGTDLRFTLRPATAQPAGNSPGRGVSISEPVAIVEQTVSEPVAGVRTWALKFDRRMRGNHELHVTLLQPHTAGEDVTLPSVMFTGAERQNGWVAVEARPEQNLQVSALSADGQPLLRVDPIDLPGMGAAADQRRRIVAGVQYVRPGYTVTVSEQTFTPVAVPTAMADRMTTTSVLSETGLLQHQLDVSFRAVGMQSLRFVLPEGGDVWAVLIDGAPVEVREAGGTYQVPLVSTTDASAARTLRLIYRSHVSPSGENSRLLQSPPVIVAVSGSGQTQPLEVLEQTWTLHYPQDLVLLRSRGLFTPTRALADDSWMAQLRAAVTLPTLAEAGWRVGIAAVLALLIACLVMIARRFGPWAFALVAVPIGGALLLALLLPAVQQSREAAKRSARMAAGETLAYEYETTTDQMAMDAEAPLAEGSRDRTATASDKSPFERESQPQSEADDSFIPLSPFGSTDAVNEPQMPQAGTPLGPAGQTADDIRPGEPAAGRPVSGTVTMTAPPAKGALLSLSLDLQAPEGSRSQQFETLAAESGGTIPALDVSYGSRSFREVIVLCLGAGLALLMWWLRHASLKCRLACVLATIVVPMALAPITPAWLSMIVEGVLLGGLAGAGLWLLLAVVNCVKSACARWCPAGWTARSHTRTAAGWLLAASLLIAGGACGPVQAEDTKATPAPPPRADVLPTVVLPYEGEDPLAAERVFLPQELFRTLWLKAYPEESPPQPTPVAGLVAEALYAIDASAEPAANNAAEEAHVRVNGRFVLFGFRAEPVWLSLPLEPVAIVTATLNEQPAVLRPGENGAPQVLIEAAGLHVLDVAFDLPAELRDMSGQLTLPLRPVTAGALTITLPPSESERDVRVLADGRQVVGSQLRTLDDGRGQLQLAVDEGGPLHVSWQPRASSGGADTIVHVDSRTALDIGDEGVQMVADYQLQVRQGVLGEVPFQFPESVRLKQITGPDVGGWQIAGEGDERTLTIFLRRNVTDATQMTAELYVPQEDGDDEFALEVPAFVPLDVTRETGDVAVLAGSYLEVRATAAEGLRQLDRDEVRLPPSRAKETAQVQLAYRFVMRPWSLSLSVQPEPPAASARAEHGVSIGLRKVQYASRFLFDLSGAPQRTLRIALTDDYFLTSVRGDGVDDWFVEDAELIIDFGQPRVGEVELVLEGHLPRDPVDTAAVIITPLPLELERQQSLLAVWVDPVYAATLDTFDTWRTIDRAELPEDLRQLQSTQPQFAFRSMDAEPEIINLELIRQQPQIAADAVTLIAVSDVSVDYGLTLRWTIERAATDTLVFTVPGWLEDRLEITGESIRQTTQSVTDEGLVRWSVQLTDAVRGQYLMSAIATLPPPEDGQVVAPSVFFEQPPTTPEGQYVSIESQQTFAVLVNLSRGRLTPAGDLDALTVRRQQLPLVLRDDLLAQAMAIVRRPPEANVAWNLQRVTEEAAQAAQVTTAELTSVLALDGSVRTLAQYRVRNRGQQFLALELPTSSRLLSVLVKGEPSRGLSASIGELPVTLIALPQTSAADLSFLVQVVLADRLPNVTRLDGAALGHVIDLPVPKVISSRQSSEFGMPVVYTSWTVHLPEDLDAGIVESSVNGTPRSNVTPQPSQTARAMSEVQLYRELDDLNRLVIDKKVTAVQRKKALSNLEYLQGQLGSSRWSASGRIESLAPQDREFAAQTEELLEESFRNVQRAEQELQQAESVITADPAVTNYFGKDFIANNNSAIFSDNSGSGIVRSDESLKKFRLNAPIADSKGEAAAKPSVNQPTDSRALLRGKLQSQQLQLSFPMQQQAPAVGGGGLADFARPEPPNMQFGHSFDVDGAQLAGIDVVGLGAGLLGAPDVWFEAGGLSLPLELPLRGQSLTFTKLGGDPRLALDVRPRETGTNIIRWVWAAVVLVAGAWLLHHAAHRTQLHEVRRGLIAACLALGLIGLLCLPVPLSLAAGLLLVAGCVLGLLEYQSVP